jgi:hypothetical protein
MIAGVVSRHWPAEWLTAVSRQGESLPAAADTSRFLGNRVQQRQYIVGTAARRGAAIEGSSMNTRLQPDDTRADPLDIDLGGFAPAVPKPKIEPAVLRQVSEANQFPSRAAPKPKALPRPARRHRTGCNVQFNIKATAETIARFTAIADKHGLVFGELLARALDAFEGRHQLLPQRGNLGCRGRSAISCEVAR